MCQGPGATVPPPPKERGAAVGAPWGGAGGKLGQGGAPRGGKGRKLGQFVHVEGSSGQVGPSWCQVGPSWDQIGTKLGQLSPA